MMVGIHRILNKSIDSKIQLPLFFLLAFAAAIWRFAPLMPHVFYGDDLSYFLSFKSGECVTVAWQLLTTVCEDKFRPVSSGFLLLLFNLFDSAIAYYMAVNVLLQAMSATLVFSIAYRLSKGRLAAAFSVAIAVATSRFAAYQVTQVIGPVEGLALPLFLGVIYSIIRADERREDAWRWGWIAILLSFLLIHNHERYIVIAVWLGVAFTLLPNFRALPVKHLVALLAACAALPVFNVTYKMAVLHRPFLVGTGDTQLAFDLGRTLVHLRQAIFSIVGFNEGPEHLVGVRLVSLPWDPAWILASTLATTMGLSILWGVRGALVKQDKQIPISIWLSVRWPILLVALAALLLVPPVATIRLEQRWLFAPFILMLLVSAWSVGRWQSKVKAPVWLLVSILSVSSILLDSRIMKHFNQVYFVDSARFAEMTKRDIADKYAGQLWDIILLANPAHCNWSLIKGGFFLIYGGHAREVKCLGPNDIPGETKYDSGVRVFAESSPGHLSDITNEWQASISAKRGRVSFDFIDAFSNGRINNSVKVDTPSGKGVLLLPRTSVLGIENTITVVSGFSYRFDDVLIERSSQLRFGLSMIYPAEPVRAIVYVFEKGVAKEDVLFSREISPPRTGEKLRFSPVSLPMTAYAGKRISLVFAAEPTGGDVSGQWLGYSNPQIVLPADNQNNSGQTELP